MKRRVLIVASWYPTASRPVAGIFVREQVRALASRYSVAVIAPDYRSWPTIIRHGVARGGSIDSEEGVTILRPTVLSFVPRHPAYARNSYVAAVRDASRRLVASWGVPDVIHAHVVLLGGFAAAMLGLELNVPVVLTEHSGPFSMHLRSQATREMVKWTLASVDRRIAVSPALRGEMQAVSVAPVEVVGNVIATSFFAPGPSTLEHVPTLTKFAFVGLMTPVKGIDVLLRACRRLLDAGYREWELYLVGDGPARTSLERMANDLELGDRCSFFGMLDSVGVRDVLRWADFAVVPSHHESFGVAAAEAMSTGVGVIGSDVGGLQYVVEANCGVLVRTGDDAALFDAMERAICGDLRFDPATVRNSIARRFSPEVFLDRITGIYGGLWRG